MNSKFLIPAVIAIVGLIIGFVLVSDIQQERDHEQESFDKIEIEDNNSNSQVRYFSDIDVSIDLYSTVVILPVFTASAYVENGFYDFYRGDCNISCLTVPIQDSFDLSHASSRKAITLFFQIGFPQITDVELHRDPSLLEQYDKVILLHNEYVTKTEFNAITTHPKVIYLYPNALYAEVNFNEEDYTISLERGHDYPAGVQNGFDWEFDNTHPYEFDTECENWNFYKINNGFMLNCYPEDIITIDIELVKKILEF